MTFKFKTRGILSCEYDISRNICADFSLDYKNVTFGKDFFFIVFCFVLFTFSTSHSSLSWYPLLCFANR